jgi:hypothetical protein
MVKEPTSDKTWSVLMGFSSNWRFEVYTPVDPFGPIKYEPPELPRIIAVLPELASRLEAVEAYLASGSKQPFIRAADRLGGEAIAQM